MEEIIQGMQYFLQTLHHQFHFLPNNIPIGDKSQTLDKTLWFKGNLQRIPGTFSHQALAQVMELLSPVCRNSHWALSSRWDLLKVTWQSSNPKPVLGLWLRCFCFQYSSLCHASRYTCCQQNIATAICLSIVSIVYTWHQYFRSICGKTSDSNWLVPPPFYTEAVLNE
jgi:hypothetical protein